MAFYSSSGSDNSIGRERSPTISSYPKGSPTLWTGDKMFLRNYRNNSVIIAQIRNLEIFLGWKLAMILHKLKNILIYNENNSF